MEENDRIILALDTPDLAAGLGLLESLDGLVRKIKIGPGLFLQEGPSIIKVLKEKGYEIFLDLKLHDIPNTVALGVKAAKKMGIWMLSLHVSGGRKMLEEAVSAAEGSPLLVGITVLTSLQDQDLREMGLCHSSSQQVEILGNLAREARLNGVVASAREAQMLRASLGPEVLVITPGIRMEGSPQDDQARTVTPAEAMRAGADYLVVGRPVVSSSDPRGSLSRILSSIREGGKV